MAMSHYNFVTRWFFRAPIERVFAELAAVEQWPAWWPGVLAVEVLAPGDGGKLGKRTCTTWKSVLPYALSFEAEVVRYEPPHRLEVQARGELVGRGRWELASDPDGTYVIYHWQVSTTRDWMNLLAPLARPAFKWNHDVIMGRGGVALARRLGQRRES
jgi:uncharacterized protein YndB with AHSA1/START domain